MFDWSSVLHALAGAVLSAGGIVIGQIIMASHQKAAEQRQYSQDHQRWAHDLASQAHDGFIVEYERLTPFFGAEIDATSPDWIEALHLKLQRMRLVCSPDSVYLAGLAMKELDHFVSVPGQPWKTVQDAFDEYLQSARQNIDLPDFAAPTEANSHRWHPTTVAARIKRKPVPTRESTPVKPPQYLEVFDDEVLDNTRSGDFDGNHFEHALPEWADSELVSAGNGALSTS